MDLPSAATIQLQKTQRRDQSIHMDITQAMTNEQGITLTRDQSTWNYPQPRPINVDLPSAATNQRGTTLSRDQATWTYPQPRPTNVSPSQTDHGCVRINGGNHAFLHKKVRQMRTHPISSSTAEYGVPNSKNV